MGLGSRDEMTPPIGADELRRLIPALQQAIEDTFNEGDWKRIGYETGTYDWIVDHDRLLRSLSWCDGDYAGHVFTAIDVIIQRDPENIGRLLQYGKIRSWMQENAQEVYSQFAGDPTFVPSFRPALPTAREVVEKAIEDAEALLASSGPVSAVDRIHTAFHGYLLSVCDRQGIAYGNDPGITDVFRLLRQNHAALQSLGARSDDLQRLLQAMATIVDVLNPLRNKASMAHPNDSLLGDEEAMLVINATRTLLHYLEAKFR